MAGRGPSPFIHIASAHSKVQPELHVFSSSIEGSVRDKIILHAISEAYRNILSFRNFPGRHFVLVDPL